MGKRTRRPCWLLIASLIINTQAVVAVVLGGVVLEERYFGIRLVAAVLAVGGVTVLTLGQSEISDFIIIILELILYCHSKRVVPIECNRRYKTSKPQKTSPSADQSEVEQTRPIRGSNGAKTPDTPE